MSKEHILKLIDNLINDRNIIDNKIQNYIKDLNKLEIQKAKLPKRLLTTKMILHIIKENKGVNTSFITKALGRSSRGISDHINFLLEKKCIKPNKVSLTAPTRVYYYVKELK